MKQTERAHIVLLKLDTNPHSLCSYNEPIWPPQAVNTQLILTHSPLCPASQRLPTLMWCYCTAGQRGEVNVGAFIWVSLAILWPLVQSKESVDITRKHTRRHAGYTFQISTLFFGSFCLIFQWRQIKAWEQNGTMANWSKTEAFCLCSKHIIDLFKSLNDLASSLLY